MHRLLRAKQRVLMQFSKESCEVGQFLGGGSQGEVYQAKFKGKLFALKWYHPESATRYQWAALEMLIKRGVPNPENNRFLWPLDLALAPDLQGFGYIMPLRKENYKSIPDLMRRRVEPSFRTLTTVGLELTDSYSQLHRQGLCYRDINFNNIFFDSTTGEVLICDNDNIALDGDPNTSVRGTFGFMAPEIVRGEALPSIQTDLYSLAVLLFYIFMIHHPLEGKKESDYKILGKDEMIELYGTKPLFIFDPEDTSNYPVQGYQDNPLEFWPIYPQFVRTLFIKAFTEGLRDPAHGRITEDVWHTALLRLLNSIFYCSHCGKENFYDEDSLKTCQSKSVLCWFCKKEIVPPASIHEL